MTLALLFRTDCGDGVAIIHEAPVIVQKSKGSLDWGEGSMEKYTQNGEVWEDKFQALGSGLDTQEW